MKRFVHLLLATLCAALCTAPAVADVTIKLPTPPLPPVPIIVPEPPLFLLPPALGFRVAVDTDDDLFEVDNRYYVFKNDIWYVGPRYNGPWQTIRIELLPPGLRKHHYREIRRLRAREYEDYRRDGERYRGKTYRPERYDDHDRYRDRDRDRDHDRYDDRERDRDRYREREERRVGDSVRDRDRERYDDRDRDRDRDRGDRGEDHRDNGKHKGHDKNRGKDRRDD